MANKIRNTRKPQNVLAKENTINRRITDDILPRLPSFVARYDSFLDTENRSVKTREAYMKDILAFFEYMTHDTGLSESDDPKGVTLEEISNLTGLAVNDYLTYIKRYEDEHGDEIQNGADSRARKRASIVGLLKFLYRQDLIDRDISEKIVSISLKESNSRAVKALQENEALDLLDVVSTGNGLTDKQLQYWERTRYRDTLIISLFTLSGLRISELQQLNISSFNMKREEFVIYRKRAKEAVMPMNRTLVQAFNEYMEKDRKHCPDVAPGHEDALFLCLTAEARDAEGNLVPAGRKRLSERQIRALVHKYTAVVIGGDGYSPHKLRATAATTAIRRGSDISRVASLLDHDSIQTTKRYIKVTEEDKREVMATMEAIDTD